MKIPPISYNINILKSAKPKKLNSHKLRNENNSTPNFKGTFPQVLFTPSSTVVSISTLVNFIRNPITTSDYEYEICDRAKEEALRVLQESFDLIFEMYKKENFYIEKEDGTIVEFYKNKNRDCNTIVVQKNGDTKKVITFEPIYSSICDSLPRKIKIHDIKYRSEQEMRLNCITGYEGSFYITFDDVDDIEKEMKEIPLSLYINIEQQDESSINASWEVAIDNGEIAEISRKPIGNEKQGNHTQPSEYYRYKNGELSEFGKLRYNKQGEEIERMKYQIGDNFAKINGIKYYLPKELK